MAEGARLESVYTATYRGFESPPHRHIQKKSSYESTGFFFAYCTYCGGMRTHDRGSTTGGSQLDRLRTQRAGCPQGERSESISPSPPYSEKELVRKYGLFFRILHVLWGDENPRPGFDNWRQPVGQTANAESGLPAGRAKRVNPPSPPYSEKELVLKYGLFFAYCTRYPADKGTVGPVSVSATGRSNIAGWRRKRLIRPTKTSQDRYALAPSGTRTSPDGSASALSGLQEHPRTGKR